MLRLYFRTGTTLVLVSPSRLRTLMRSPLVGRTNLVELPERTRSLTSSCLSFWALSVKVFSAALATISTAWASASARRILALASRLAKSLTV